MNLANKRVLITAAAQGIGRASVLAFRDAGAQVIATGPTARALAMPETFSTVIDAAQHDLLITTPYFVPDGALLSSI